MPTTRSPLPSFELPQGDLWNFLFERSDLPFPEDKVMLRDADTKRSYTFAQTRNTAIEFGKGLKSVWEWRKGDVLALFTPNSIDVPSVMWGCQWAGGVLTTVNPGYTVDEFVFQLKDSGARAIVTQLPLLAVAVKAAKAVGIPEDNIALLGDDKDPSYRFKHFTSIRNLAGTSRYRRSKAKPDDLAFLPYSSGTTGKPKGVMLSHSNIASNVLMNHIGEAPNLSWQQDKICAFLPFFHIYGLTVLIHHAFHGGYELVVMPRFDMEKFCKTVQEEKITMVYVAPPVVLQLSKHPIVDKYDLSSIRMMNSGAAPLTKDLVEAMYERIKIPVKQGYGLSETSPTNTHILGTPDNTGGIPSSSAQRGFAYAVAFLTFHTEFVVTDSCLAHMQPWSTWRSHVGSVGLLLSNQEAKYMSPEDKEVAVGDTGELWLKGPNVFKGYLNNEEGTKNAITNDGFFKTGDVGYQDADGNFYITDRVKELIKYKGFQVPPAELEGYIQAHPKVTDAAVIGVEDKSEATEVPRAYIVPKPGVEGNDELSKEITEWIASKVANHKRLRGGIRYISEIPKSVTGKILRRKLKEEVAKEAQVKSKL